jgi:X breakpoint 2-interacting protein
MQQNTLKQKLKTETRTNLTANEQLKKLKADLAFSKTHFKHETRKHKGEQEKIKEKLSKLMSEKPKQGVSFLITNLINSKCSQQDNEDQGMFNIVIKNYEAREKEIMQENSFLRQLLYDCYHSIDQKIIEVSQNVNSHRPEITNKKIHNAVFQLPLELMRDTVLEAVYKNIDDLCNVLNSENVNSDKIKSLTAQIGILKLYIAEQESEIQKQQSSIGAMDINSDANDRLKLKDEWKLLETNKMQLEDERRKFTDAAIKMGLERANLQRERAELDEKRSSTIRNNIMQSVPSTPKYIYN